MDETQDNALMRFLNEKLVPFSTKVADNQALAEEQNAALEGVNA